MSWPMAFLVVVIQIFLLVVFPPFLAMVIVKVKARCAGRTGPPLMQMYYDLNKLWGKGLVISHTTSPVFRIGPLVVVGTSFVAGLMVPIGGQAAPLHFTGDMIVIAYLFGLGRAALVLPAMDTGSPFEGMGSSREACFSALVEPTFFLILMTLGFLGHLDPGTREVEWSLTSAIDNVALSTWIKFGPALVPMALALFAVLLVENARIPIDDPTTHLELTMIHEVMILDHSGPDLALLEYGAAQKYFVMIAILTQVVVPFNFGHPLIDLAFFTAGTLVLTAVVAFTEVSIARLRMNQVPRFLLGAFILAALAVGVILFELPAS